MVSADTFFQHMDAFVDYRKLIYEVSDQTIKSNSTDLKLFEDFIHGKPYDIIHGQAVMDFQYYLKKERANCGGSINRKIFTLRAYSNFLKLRSVPDAQDLPFQDVLKIRGGYRNRPNALAHGEIKLFFDAIDRTTFLGIRDYAVYALMYLLGLRVGEVFRLHLESIDFENHTITIVGKGNRIRVLHLTPEMIQVLSEWIAVRKHFGNSDQNNALFISKKGNRLAIRTMEDNFKKIVSRAGLKTHFNITCHTMRHSFASHLNDEDTDILVIQGLMGHSSPRSAQAYIHPSQDKIRQALEKLPGVIYMNKLVAEGMLHLKFQSAFRPKRE